MCKSDGTQLIQYVTGVIIKSCLQLLYVVASRKKAALELAREYIREVPDSATVVTSQKEDDNVPESADTDQAATHKRKASTSNTNEPPAKKKLMLNFQDLCDADDAGLCQRNELAEYVNLKIGKDVEVVEFWKDNRFLFPKLFVVANRVLCIPATSAASERLFSVAGRMLEKRRTSLSAGSLNNLLFLHSNLE